MESTELETVEEFSPENVVRKVPFETEKLRVILLCLEAGQKTTPYAVPVSDAFLYVVKGKGSVTVGGEEQEIKEGSLVFIPAESKRGLNAYERITALSCAAPPQSNIPYPPKPETK